VLTKLCKKYCDDQDGTLQNDLVGGSGQVISAEPARRVAAMARLIEKNKDAVTLFRNASPAAIEQYIGSHTQLNSLYTAYLEKFGERCLDELKLESATLHDEPLPLLRAIGHFAGREGGSQAGEDMAATARRKAEEKTASALKGKVLKNFIFKRVLKQARARVENRENLRFERTRLFGRVRKIMLELGRRFEAFGLLGEARDVFYLEKDEILSYVEGFASCPDLRGIVAVRKKHFAEYQQADPIADRFETYGIPFVGNDFTRPPVSTEGGDSRSGIGCCPGRVRGTVRVVRDPRGVELPAGCILVAERTDPGWIMLFPAASGLLVQKGSLLSHSAIVARELGLPAIVAIPDVTNWLQNGDEVEFDGSSGEVRLIKRAEEEKESETEETCDVN